MILIERVAEGLALRPCAASTVAAVLAIPPIIVTDDELPEALAALLDPDMDRYADMWDVMALATMDVVEGASL